MLGLGHIFPDAWHQTKRLKNYPINQQATTSTCLSFPGAVPCCSGTYRLQMEPLDWNNRLDRSQIQKGGRKKQGRIFPNVTPTIVFLEVF